MLKIIIVDDEIEILNGLKLKVDWENQGFKILDVFSDSTLAYEFIKKNEIDIIITDINMPKINGIELIKLSKEVNPCSKFVILSAYSDFDYAKQGLKVGAFDYILKPITRKELTQVLENLKESFKIKNTLNNKFEFNGYIDYLQEHFFLSVLQNKNYENYEFVEREAKKLKFGLFNKKDNFFKFIHIEFTSNYILKKPNKTDTILSSNENYLTLLPLQLIVKETIVNLGFEEIAFSFHMKEYPTLLNIFISTNDYNSLDEIVGIIIDNVKSNSVKYLNYSVNFYESNIINSFNNIKDEFYLNVDKRYINRPPTFIKNSEEMAKDLEILKIDITYYIQRKNKTEVLEYLKNKLNNIEDKIIFSKFILHILIIFDEIAQKNNLNINFTYELFSEEYKIKYLDYDYVIKFIEQKLIQLLFEIKPLNLSSGQDVIYEIKDYIDKNYMYNINLTDLSKNFYINSTYLSEMFKKNLNISFVKYLTDIRLEKSIILLASNKFTVLEVGIMVGFNSGNYFSNVFKRKYGVSPKEYKANITISDQ